MTGRDLLVTVATDSMEMYRSRLAELTEQRGGFTTLDAAAAFHHHLLGVATAPRPGFLGPKRAPRGAFRS
ncbi:MAG: hypothetical protein M3349_00905 [Actinomycetota bacterium]|nr:hypothetical protein [Actinomycetota bacterium]